MVVVGTHVDLVNNFHKKKAALEQTIEKYYSCTKFYPKIKAISFVSYKSSHKYAINKLCDKLYEIAASLETHLGY